MTRTGSGDQIGVAEARPEAVMRHHRAAWRLERVAWGVMAPSLSAWPYPALPIKAAGTNKCIASIRQLCE